MQLPEAVSRSSTGHPASAAKAKGVAGRGCKQKRAIFIAQLTIADLAKGLQVHDCAC